ncbi:ribonucleoside-triphosphate reductase, adenosylcobalamin-dependent [Neobacillus rhizosphaerae]|uniref:ribonucleoside-triphosphate reductase, adenosylcobalamin-dependent n=1 Tax=Neobacillus rhizosphaerae TaxID=2880965 RepID=UPI003D272F4C
MKEITLSPKFLRKYPDFPSHMNAIGTFVYLRTYSRYLPEKGRRETWKETVTRAVQYNVNLLRKHVELFDLPITYKELMEEAEAWFHSMFNLDQFLSGRTMWVGGAEGGVAEKFPLGNFNCSFIAIEKWEDLADQFYLLLVGTGVGFKHTFKMAENIAPVRDNFTVTHKEYEDLYSLGVRIDTTTMSVEGNKATIVVGDSKEGWVESLKLFFRLITLKQYEDLTEIHFVYDFVRPNGARLLTFGGTASGHIPLMEMFTNFEKVIKNQIDPTLEPPVRVDDKYVRLRPIHVLDFGNFLGNNVVVGGVRRTAEIFLIDGMKDVESIFAKYGLNGFWTEEMFQRHEQIMAEADRLGIKVPESARKVGERKHGVSLDGITHQFDTKEEADALMTEKGDGFYMYPINLGTGLHHRRMSNNSVAFTSKPPRELLRFIFLMMKAEGEPAFINLEELAMRRFKMLGTNNPTRKQLEEVMEKLGMNPCAEILLWTLGVCNLTTINVTRFVYNGKLDLEGLLEAQRRSTRAGLRMTLVELELPHWAKRQNTDRLLGLSLTGWKDAMGQLKFNRDQEKELLALLKKVGREEADAYARKLRIATPLLTTTVKPEGTISQVAGGVSSGLHYAHSEYYIRRIRISANDPLAKAVLAHEGWVVNPEVGTEGATREEQMKNARTLVIDFPVYSGADVTKDDVDIDEQFDTYFMFQDYYTEHNASNTITVKPHEWDRAEERVWNGWNNFVGVSFLAHDGGTYALAPYEKCDKETYERLKKQMQEFNMNILAQYEVGSTEDFDIGQDGCESGICPVR